jgi:signal transduction histidine kinase
VDNAVKYTPPGGHVRVAARPADGNVIMTVTDTGIGISRDELPRIWERLYRGDRSRSERGLGLGLSLVRAIVEAHGGTVEVVSTPGEGSRFTIVLGAP